jgi:ABC-type sugar transport system substrate-binding protein
MAMLGARRWIWAGLLIPVVGLTGCGKDPFGPPEREESTETGSDLKDKGRTIFFVSPRLPDEETIEIAKEAQAEANLQHAIFKIMAPPASDPKLDQVELVKMTLNDDVSGLILMPGESPGLAKILAEAEAKGVPVVLVGRSVPAPEGSKPFTFVDFAPLGESASKVVATTIDDLKKAGRPIEGTVLVLADQATDRNSADRVAALKAAASSAGLTKVVEVPINGKNEAQAKAQASEALKAHPDTMIFLTDDPETMVAAGLVVEERKGQPMIAIGGFVEFTPLKSQIPLNLASCYAQGRYQRLGKLASETLLSKLNGQKVPDRVLLPPLFHQITLRDRSAPVPPKRPVPSSTPTEPAEPKK